MIHRQISIALFAVLFLTSAHVFAASVHPVWGPASTGGTPSTASHTLRYGNYWQQTPAEQSPEAQMKSRVCERIARRFPGEPSLLSRVNERLKERFGFSCSNEDLIRPGSQLPSAREEIPAELRIARDAFNTVNDFVAKGSSRIPMLRAVFSASCVQGITIDDITVHDTGAGVPSDLSAIYMVINGERVSRSRIPSRTKTAQLRFRRPYTISACKSVTIDFYAAVSPTALAFGRHTISIASPEDIAADAPVAGDFPIVGERMSISSGNTGKITVSYLPIDVEPRVDGSDHEVIGRVRLAVDLTEDQTLHAIQFRNGGSSEDGDVLGLYVRSTQGHARFTEISDRMALDRMFVRFDPPLPLEKGEVVDLDVVANVVTGTGTSLKIMLDEPIDVYAVGSFYGYGRNGQLYGSEVIIQGEPKPLRIRGFTY